MCLFTIGIGDIAPKDRAEMPDLIQDLGPFCWLMSQDLGELIHAEMTVHLPHAHHLRSVFLCSRTHCPFGLALVSEQRHI